MATEKRLDLISRGRLLRDIYFQEGRYPESHLLRMAIREQPTVDAVEVAHGRWIEKIDVVSSYLAGCEELFYECSVCNAPNFGESPYCPNCGAKMDGGNEDG